jgi:competence protein ComEC
MTEFFRKAPFVRLLLPFLAGMVVGFSFGVNQFCALVFLIITFLLAFGLVILNKISKDLKYQWLVGVAIHLFLVVAGLFIAKHEMDRLTHQFIPSNRLLITCMLKDYPEEKLNSYKCIAQTYYYKQGDTVIAFRNKVVLYFSKGEDVKKLRPGDVISTFVYPNRIVQAERLKGEFDYAAYMLKHGICYTAYVKDKSWQVIDRDQLFFLYKWAIHSRESLLKIYRNIGFTGREFGVLSALTIGYKLGLDDDIKQAYSAAGTMHVLAVSGMHVGLIYVVLMWAFSFLGRIKFGSVIKVLMIVLIVWYYAFLTGLSPSVLRASVMITCIGLGQLTRRKLSVYNSLAIAAFLLLLIQPTDLMDVGFQLSFLAVLGIVSLFPVINSWVVSHGWINKIWSLAAVSLSAQLATFPLSLYYFHQFPNYFLLANLIVVPLATLGIYGSIILIILSEIKLLLAFVGPLLYGIVFSLNETVCRIERLPFSTTKGITITGYHVVMWYVLIVFAILYMVRKKGTYLMISLSSVLCLLWLDIGLFLF